MYGMKLIIGDQYHDGHGQYHAFNLVAAIPREEVEAAYKLGSEIVGFDFANNCCEDYEQSTIADEHARMLKEAGINLSTVDEYDDELQFNTDSFVDTILEIIKLGNPDAEVQVVPDSVIPTLSLGGRNSFGYGLFYN